MANQFHLPIILGCVTVVSFFLHDNTIVVSRMKIIILVLNENRIMDDRFYKQTWFCHFLYFTKELFTKSYGGLLSRINNTMVIVGFALPLHHKAQQREAALYLYLRP